MVPALPALEPLQSPSHIVIQRGLTHYRQPVTGEVTARCLFGWARFVRTLVRHGRARITLYAEVFGDGRIGAQFEGDFVAVRELKRP